MSKNECHSFDASRNAAPSAIALHDVTIAYHRHPVVHHLSGIFVNNEATAIVGPNGAGKSSLLKALMGQLPLSSGVISSSFTMKDMAYLPQLTGVDRSFPLTVSDVLAFGTWRTTHWFSAVDNQLGDRISHALSKVGLTGFEDRVIDELSVGQFQRVLFARLIIQNASLILLDEPFTSLDQRTTDDLLALIDSWIAEGKTVLAVLHDLHQVRQHFSQTLLLSREKIAWGKTADVLTPEAIQSANHRSLSWTLDAQICQQSGVAHEEGKHHV